MKIQPGLALPDQCCGHTAGVLQDAFQDNFLRPFSFWDTLYVSRIPIKKYWLYGYMAFMLDKYD